MASCSWKPRTTARLKIADTDAFVRREIPDAEPCCKKIPKGPALTFVIEARFRGPDSAELAKLADQAGAIMRATPRARDVRCDWRRAVKVIRPRFSEEQARRAGVSRDDVAQALQWSCNGAQIGIYREHDELIPIMARPPAEERSSATQLVGDHLSFKSGVRRAMHTKSCRTQAPGCANTRVQVQGAPVF